MFCVPVTFAHRWKLLDVQGVDCLLEQCLWTYQMRLESPADRGQCLSANSHRSICAYFPVAHRCFCKLCWSKNNSKDTIKGTFSLPWTYSPFFFFGINLFYWKGEHLFLLPGKWCTGEQRMPATDKLLQRCLPWWCCGKSQNPLSLSECCLRDYKGKWKQRCFSKQVPK